MKYDDKNYQKKLVTLNQLKNTRMAWHGLWGPRYREKSAENSLFFKKSQSKIDRVLKTYKKSSAIKKLYFQLRYPIKKWRRFGAIFFLEQEIRISENIMRTFSLTKLLTQHPKTPTEKTNAIPNGLNYQHDALVLAKKIYVTLEEELMNSLQNDHIKTIPLETLILQANQEIEKLKDTYSQGERSVLLNIELGRVQGIALNSLLSLFQQIRKHNKLVESWHKKNNAPNVNALVKNIEKILQEIETHIPILWSKNPYEENEISNLDFFLEKKKQQIAILKQYFLENSENKHTHATTFHRLVDANYETMILKMQDKIQKIKENDLFIEKKIECQQQKIYETFQNYRELNEELKKKLKKTALKIDLQKILELYNQNFQTIKQDYFEQYGYLDGFSEKLAYAQEESLYSISNIFEKIIAHNKAIDDSESESESEIEIQIEAPHITQTFASSRSMMTVFQQATSSSILQTGLSKERMIEICPWVPLSDEEYACIKFRLLNYTKEQIGFKKQQALADRTQAMSMKQIVSGPEELRKQFNALEFEWSRFLLVWTLVVTDNYHLEFDYWKQAWNMELFYLSEWLDKIFSAVEIAYRRDENPLLYLEKGQEFLKIEIRELQRFFHPDKHHQSPQKKEEAENAFKELELCRAWIEDEFNKKRRDYFYTLPSYHPWKEFTATLSSGEKHTIKRPFLSQQWDVFTAFFRILSDLFLTVIHITHLGRSAPWGRAPDEECVEILNEILEEKFSTNALRANLNQLQIRFDRLEQEMTQFHEETAERIRVLAEGEAEIPEESSDQEHSSSRKRKKGLNEMIKEVDELEKIVQQYIKAREESTQINRETPPSSPTLMSP